MCGYAINQRVTNPVSYSRTLVVTAAFGTGEKRYCNERSHIACIIQKLPIWDLEMGGAMGYYMGKGTWVAVIGRSTVFSLI